MQRRQSEPFDPEPDTLVIVKIISTGSELTKVSRKLSIEDSRPVVVMTMGALHEGHCSLIRKAATIGRPVLVSIFVNPLQFNNPADLECYPRDFEQDAARLQGARCNMVFTGSLEQFFPGASGDLGTFPKELLLDPGPNALGLEGDYRPGHFAGVATIVARLFDVVSPDWAYFGAKDFQQCRVVQDLVPPGGQPQILPCSTIRSESGLALSSRNEHLSAEGLELARCLSQALARAQEAWLGGQRQPEVLERCMREHLLLEGVEVEYAAVRDPGHWTAATPERLLDEAVGLVAAQVDGVRLIDNHLLHGPRLELAGG